MNIWKKTGNDPSMPKIRIYNYSMITKEKETLKETRDNREGNNKSKWMVIWKKVSKYFVLQV